MTFYLFVAGAYFTFLLLGVLSGQKLSKIDRALWLTLVVASALWILVIPVSLFEIGYKAWAKARSTKVKQTKSQTDSSPTVSVEDKDKDKDKELDSNTLSRLKNT